MTAVERLNHYHTSIPKERVSEKKVAESWPEHGEIKIKNLTMRYRPNLPLVLNGVNLHIRSREKIGVVGRTGSGKSSLIQALFRIVESEKGSKIVIDSVDVSKLPLQTLRSKLSIIPQDPVLFSGTIRRNLDPFGMFQDDELWSVLQMVELETCVFFCWSCGVVLLLGVFSGCLRITSFFSLFLLLLSFLLYSITAGMCVSLKIIFFTKLPTVVKILVLVSVN